MASSVEEVISYVRLYYYDNRCILVVFNPRMVASLVFTLLLFSPLAYGFPCRVNSCITCSSSPVNCTVTPIDEYTYNYYCEAPLGCTPRNVSGPNDQDGYYCTANLFIRNLNSTDFSGHWFAFEVGNTCEEVSGFDVNVGSKVRFKLTNNCLNITKTESSLERINIPCFCKGDNCQDVFNVTIIIDPPDDGSSSTLVITSSSSPSPVHSSVHPSVHPSVHSSVHLSVHPSVPLVSLSSSTTVDNVMSSSLIRATTVSSSTPTLLPPSTATPSNTPTTNTVSAMTTALGESHALDYTALDS